MYRNVLEFEAFFTAQSFLKAFHFRLQRPRVRKVRAPVVQPIQEIARGFRNTALGDNASKAF
jgi:hypothetical protein